MQLLALKAYASMVCLNALLALMQTPLPLLEIVQGQMVANERLVQFGRINFSLFLAVVSSPLKFGRNNRFVCLLSVVYTNACCYMCKENVCFEGY